MEITSSIILNKVNLFVNNKLTRAELGHWAKEVFYYCLKNRFVDLESISLYKFITKLVRVSDIHDPCSISEIIEIKDIIEGSVDAVYSIKMKIPVLYQDNNLNEIYNLLNEYCLNRSLSSDKRKTILNWSNELCKQPSIAILELFNQVFYSEFSVLNLILEEGGNLINPSGTLFIDYKEIDEMTILKKIIRFFDCCLGNDFFFININYKKGIPVLSILT